MIHMRRAAVTTLLSQLRADATSSDGPHPRPLSLKGRGEILHQDGSGAPSPVQGEGVGG